MIYYEKVNSMLKYLDTCSFEFSLTCKEGLGKKGQTNYVDQSYKSAIRALPFSFDSL